MQAHAKTELPVFFDNSEMGKKSDVGQRLADEMKRVKIDRKRLADETGVTVSAIYGWTNTGRFDRRHHDTFTNLGMDVAWILTGLGQPRSPGDSEPVKLSGDALVLAQTWSSMTQRHQDQVWEMVFTYFAAEQNDPTLLALAKRADNASARDNDSALVAAHKKLTDPPKAGRKSRS